MSEENQSVEPSSIQVRVGTFIADIDAKYIARANRLELNGEPMRDVLSFTLEVDFNAATPILTVRYLLRDRSGK